MTGILPATPPRRTIAVDFHGVICSYATSNARVHPGYVSPDPPNPGAIAWLIEMAADFNIVVMSGSFADPHSRRNAIANCWDWLVRYGIPRELICKEPDDHHKPIHITSTRPKCVLLIDDRAMRFEGRFPAADEIRDFQPWKPKSG